MASSFLVSGETVTLDSNRMIDNSIIEAARGDEQPGDLPLGGLPELLPEGLNVVVNVDRRSGVLSIYFEDI